MAICLNEFLVGSRTVTKSELSSCTPYTRPLGLEFTLRRSTEISSWKYSFGPAQSHSVITTLRSMPVGREGAGGSAPFLMRSDQSAYSVSMRLRPTRVATELIWLPTCAD